MTIINGIEIDDIYFEKNELKFQNNSRKNHSYEGQEKDQSHRLSFLINNLKFLNINNITNTEFDRIIELLCQHLFNLKKIMNFYNICDIKDLLFNSEKNKVIINIFYILMVTLLHLDYQPNYLYFQSY